MRNFLSTRKGIVLVGIIIGVLAALLQSWATRGIWAFAWPVLSGIQPVGWVFTGRQLSSMYGLKLLVLS